MSTQTTSVHPDLVHTLPDYLRDHMSTIAHLEPQQIVALANARRFGRTRVFDILADANLHTSGWHYMWDEALRAVKEAAQQSKRGDVREAQTPAGEVAAASAVAVYLNAVLSNEDYAELMSGWRTAAALK